MKRKLWVMLGSVAVVAVVLLLWGCQGTVAAKSKPLEDKSVTEAVNSIFATYSNSIIKADGSRWIALWDEEGVQLPPDVPMRIGKSAIAAAELPGFQPGVVEDFQIHTQEVKTSGDLAFARGTYTVQLSPAAGGALVDGKFLTIFRKQADGSWKIFRDCFNSNVPSAG